MKTIKWGIIGTGKIADMYANTIRYIEDAEVFGVTARNLDKAAQFAAAHGIPHVFDTIDALLASGEIDCIFIGTPHSAHREQVRLAIDAGKPVLCTKPMTLSVDDSIALLAHAYERGVLLYESMWHLFKPTMLEAKRRIAEGAIGDIAKVEIHCCFRAEFDPANRLFDKSLGGGSMLDVGVYAVSLCQFFLDSDPLEIKSIAHVGPTGCDHTADVLMRYPGDVLALVESGIVTEERQELRITGTNGILRIDGFWNADRFVLERADGTSETVVTEDHSAAFSPQRHDYMIRLFGDCVRSGLRAIPGWSASGTIAVQRIMTEALRQVGITYDAH